MGPIFIGQRRKAGGRFAIVTKTPRRPVARKIRRNPLARELAAGKFRPRVVKKSGTYKRRPKHPKEPEEVL
jgi:hypothetical protein